MLVDPSNAFPVMSLRRLANVCHCAKCCNSVSVCVFSCQALLCTKSQQSRRLRKALAHVLYASVELVTNRQCKTTLIALSKQPENAGYVRRLVVRPNCIEWTLPGEEVSEDLFAGLICSIAPTLRYLEAFVWDGLEMPRDDLWLALRTSCVMR